MKRSEINAHIEAAKAFFAEHGFHLPPFAFWSPDDWREKGPECREIVACQMGWDLTDFGLGDYSDYGLMLFTVRNGDPAGQFGAKSYCEKIMIADENQRTPTHMHKLKMEDIINRGGGNLIIQLWNSDDVDSLADNDVEVSMDGVLTRVPAGGTVTLEPGQSITLPDRLQHEFWGETGKGRVLIGEVSKVNDDAGDNYFQLEVGRFPEIEEDEPPVHLLVGDYPTYYRYC